MITANGTTWTDVNETFEAYDKIKAIYGEAIVEPSCGTEDIKGCGKTTSYIVIAGHEMTRDWKNYWWMPKCFVTVYKIEALDNFKCLAIPKITYYVPVQMCTSCAAARSGYRCGLRQPEAKAQELHLARTGSITAEEMETYVTVFERAFQKGLAKRSEYTKAKGSDRYRMNGKKESPSNETMVSAG